MRHFRLREEGYVYGHYVPNVTLCKIDLDKKKGTPTTRDWAAVTCPECRKIKAECDKIGQKIPNSLKNKRRRHERD